MTIQIIDLAEARARLRPPQRHDYGLTWPVGIFLCVAFYVLMFKLLVSVVPAMAHPLIHLPF